MVQRREVAANIRVIHNAVLKKAAPVWILNKHTLLYCKHYIVIQVLEEGWGGGDGGGVRK